MSDVSMDHEFLRGLKALVVASFPKRCSACGKIFETAAQFITETRSIRQGITGLKQSVDDDNATIVELYRNCPCGSTLMDFFSDRRDNSEAGQHRRLLFGNLIKHLQGKGLSHEASRARLLEVLRGGATEADWQLLSHLKPPD